MELGRLESEKPETIYYAVNSVPCAGWPHEQFGLSFLVLTAGGLVDAMTGSETDELSETQVFEILQNPRRRYILSYLAREGGEAEFSDLVDHVSYKENNISVDELTDSQRRRVYVSLTQAHIPQLEEAGIVNYHDDRGVVERRPRASQVERYMDNQTDESKPWPVFYFALALVASGAVASHWINSSGSMFALTLTVSILLLVLSIVHFAYSYSRFAP